MRASADLYAAQIERLRVDLAVDRYLKQPAKLVDIDIRGREGRFPGVRAAARQVVVPSGDVDLCPRRNRSQQQQGGGHEFRPLIVDFHDAFCLLPQ
jgi:hypothetical protein